MELLDLKMLDLDMKVCPSFDLKRSYSDLEILTKIKSEEKRMQCAWA